METILTSALAIFAIWSFALALSTGRMMKSVWSFGAKPRKEDWFQLVGTVLVSVLSAGVLIVAPSLVTEVSPGFIALEIGITVLLWHLTERLVFSCKGIKQRFSHSP